MSGPKRVPQRTCVGCRSTGGKRDFVRVVRTPEGAVEIDPTGKANGRGGYLCRKPSCWQAALTTGRLARALRATISPEARAALERYVEQLEPAAAGVES